MNATNDLQEGGGLRPLGSQPAGDARYEVVLQGLVWVVGGLGVVLAHVDASVKRREVGLGQGFGSGGRCDDITCRRAGGR